MKPIGIATDPERLSEAWGSELYPLGFNDGFEFAQGEEAQKAFWLAYREAKRLGVPEPRGYAHAFNDGYREAKKQTKRGRQL